MIQKSTSSTISSKVGEWATADHASVISVIRDLVQIPTRGGFDEYSDIINYVVQWFEQHGLTCSQLFDETTDRPVALVCDIVGGNPGSRYVLDACLDTAPFGDLAAWQHAPTSGAVENGWLYGRGSSDSKAAVAIFMHLAQRLNSQTEDLCGTLTLLFDADEHTGNFGGAKRYFEGSDAPSDIQGVMIGYPGLDELVIGGRGFLRADITVHGEAGHSGSHRDAENTNAIEKAAELVRTFTAQRTPGQTDPILGLPPKLTVTKIAGGESYSIIPDSCTVSVDARLTRDFDEKSARNIIYDAVNSLDQNWPTQSAPTAIVFHESWPAYRLDDSAPILRSMTQAINHYLDDEVTVRVAGPSNIGNYLAKLGIGTTAGFGVRYKNLHGTNERIDLETIPLVQSVYHEAVLGLLSSSNEGASEAFSNQDNVSVASKYQNSSNG